MVKKFLEIKTHERVRLLIGANVNQVEIKNMDIAVVGAVEDHIIILIVQVQLNRLHLEIHRKQTKNTLAASIHNISHLNTNNHSNRKRRAI